MDLGSLFLIFAVLVLVAAFVSRPFIMREFSTAGGKTVKQDDSLERKRSALLAEHERLLNALQELDFDQALGKIPAEEYPVQRAALLQTAAGVLRQLDSFAEQQPQQAAEVRLEAAIAAHRADAGAADALTQPGGAQTNSEMDDIETLIAERRSARKEKSAGFCPRCGKPVQKSDVFCSKCGEKIA